MNRFVIYALVLKNAFGIVSFGQNRRQVAALESWHKLHWKRRTIVPGLPMENERYSFKKYKEVGYEGGKNT